MLSFYSVVGHTVFLCFEEQSEGLEDRIQYAVQFVSELLAHHVNQTDSV